MTTFADIVAYYSNLLIIQYHNKPKAKALIELCMNEILASGVALDVLNGYDLETAVGHQLDILGKYIGTDRFYVGDDLTDMFSLITYTESALDEDVNAVFNGRWGFVDYDDFDNPAYDQKGVLNYNSIFTQGFQLNDNDYRTLLKFKIIKNYSNGSEKEIDDALFNFFGDDVVMEQTDTMEITYTVPYQLTPVMLAAIKKEVLPRPMGVRLELAESP